MTEQIQTQRTVPTKQCKVCHQVLPLEHFRLNPNARDGTGRNSICGTKTIRGCFGQSTDTDRGKARTARERTQDKDNLQLAEELYPVFRTGDPAKDFFIKQLLKVALLAKNEQAQLQAMKMLAEFKGLNKEAPQSESDLIAAALDRMKQQADAATN